MTYLSAMRRIIFLIAMVFLTCGISADAADRSDKLKPRWMTSSLPKPKSPGYIFVRADGRGKTQEEARHNALIHLRAKLEDDRQLEFEYEGVIDKRKENTQSKGSSSKTSQFVFKSKVTGSKVVLTCKEVDEYWEYKNGIYTVDDLFTVNDAVGVADKRGIDDIRLTTSYGAAPVFYSLIPGVGQFAKGSMAKGGMILGGTAVGAAAIIVCENQRATYAKKMKEHPQHIDFYRNKKADWELGRNVVIGATAALYIYNLIDAAIAPGRRRVIVNKRQYEYSFYPVVLDDSFGVGFAMNF